MATTKVEAAESLAIGEFAETDFPTGLRVVDHLHEPLTSMWKSGHELAAMTDPRP